MKKTISTILIFILVIMLGVGIAYAYFAARIIGQEKASTISLTGGKMIIEYSENSGVIELSGIYPKADAWATKIITVKGTNTTDATMKYDLGLNVTANGFRNSYISYDLKLLEGNNGTPISNITGKYINGTGYKRFGIGTFASANEEIHKYELKIYFKNKGIDQNDAQGATFNAKVVITDAGSDVPSGERSIFDSSLKSKIISLAEGDKNNVLAIKESSVEPTSENKETKNIVSTTASKYPIYMWYEDGTIYWWSEEKNPYLVGSQSYLFSSFNNLSDISGLANWNVSKMSAMNEMFYGCNISDLAPLSNWNVSNVNNMNHLFRNQKGITDITPLKNWNTSKVKQMFYLFSGTSIQDISPLSNWDISNVTDLGYIFNGTKITNFNAISFWDTSNVISLDGSFSNYKGTNLSGLENWDTSKVTNMHEMCYYCSNLTDASAINNWNISNVTNFYHMFGYASDHPVFTQREGTWSSGTFTPTN